MKAMILAAGKGSRLRPFTYFVPKTMIKINNKPVIDYCLELLNKNGINEIMINLHHRYSQIMKHVGNRAIFSYEERLKETAGALKVVSNWLDDNFVVLNGDTITTVDIRSMIDLHMKSLSMLTIYTRDDAINSGGLYIFNKKILDLVPATIPWSIHKDLIPYLLNNKFPINLYRSSAYYFDIGTWDGLKKAKFYYEKNIDTLSCL